MTTSTTPPQPTTSDSLAFFPGISERLDAYVYLLRDPRDREVFYVGKGRHDRAYQHARGIAKGTVKLDRIRSIQQAGQQVIVEVLRHGMDDETAFEVEAAAIDLVRLINGPQALHNLVAGHGLDDRGYQPLSELRARYGAEQIVIDPQDRIVFINVNRAFRPGMTSDELYAITREWWRMAPHRKDPRIALATYRGVVRGAWQIDPTSWERHPEKNRWRFSGAADLELSAKYEWKDVSHIKAQGAQNPIGYSGCSIKSTPAAVAEAADDVDASFIASGHECATKQELAALLREWVSGCDELTIGDKSGGHAGIKITVGGHPLRVHADTRREAIERYLELAGDLGDELAWYVVASRDGTVRKVCVEPDRSATAGLYIYANTPLAVPATV